MPVNNTNGPAGSSGGLTGAPPFALGQQQPLPAIPSQQLNQIRSGQEVDGWEMGRGNYVGPTPTESNDPTGNPANFENVIYRTDPASTGGTARWNTWNLDGTYRGAGTGPGNNVDTAVIAATAAGMGGAAAAANGAGGAVGGAATGAEAYGGAGAEILGSSTAGYTPGMGLAGAGGTTAGTVAGAAGTEAATGSGVVSQVLAEPAAATTTVAGGGGVPSSLAGAATRAAIGIGGAIAANNATQPNTGPGSTDQINQQRDANIDAARITNQMNRVDSNTPYGSERFTQVADPSVPGGFRTVRDVTLSPAQQRLLDSTTQGQQGRLDTANSWQGRLNDTYSTPFSLNPFGQSGRVTPPLGMDRLDEGRIPTSSRVSTNSNYERLGPGGVPQGELVSNDAIPRGDRFSGGGPQARDLYGQTGYSGSVDAVRRSVMDQFDNANRQAFEEQRAGLENRLKNMGLTEGTEAYDREMRNLQTNQGQQRNDAIQRAIQMGGQEQTRLADIDLRADDQRFGQQQTADFTNRLTTTGFNNTVASGDYERLLSALNQRNTARGSSYDRDLARTGLNNTTETARINSGINTTGFNNTAGQQDFTNYTDVTDRNNRYADRTFNNQVTAVNTNNTARADDINTAMRVRAMPLSEYNAFTSGTQPTLPQFQPYGMATVNPVNTTAINQNAVTNDMNRANRTAGYIQQGVNLVSAMPWESFWGP